MDHNLQNVCQNVGQTSRLHGIPFIKVKDKRTDEQDSALTNIFTEAKEQIVLHTIQFSL